MASEETSAGVRFAQEFNSRAKTIETGTHHALFIKSPLFGATAGGVCSPSQFLHVWRLDPPPVTARSRFGSAEFAGPNRQSNKGSVLNLFAGEPFLWETTIPAGELELHSKLVLPLGEPPFPAVVLVHGSGADSAVDTYFMPYLFAAHGIATLVYDKRGTGGSTGTYNQNFYLLSDDTVAAAEWLRDRPEIDPNLVHLAGYSQGGWIAPLAASKSDAINSLLINYGPMVPITEEDRWGYRYVLQQKGFGDDALAEADRINEVLSLIFDHSEDRWDELGVLLDEAEGTDWFKTVTGSDSMLGFVGETKMPMWMARLYYKWMTRGDEVFVDRLYDPFPVVAKLDNPSLWIFGDQDSSIPSADSIDKLEILRQQGRPIDVEIFPRAEHGILLFEGDDPFDRRYLGYAPGYLDLQVSWLRQQSGLTP